MSSGERPTGELERAVAAANAAFYEAFERRSVERMAEAWAKGAPVSCIHPGWAPLVGRDAVLESWASIFRGTARARFRLREPRIFVQGDTAWVVLYEELALEQVSGERIHAVVLATNVLVREADGVFRLVHHQAGPPPADALRSDAPGDPSDDPASEAPPSEEPPPILH